MIHKRYPTPIRLTPWARALESHSPSTVVSQIWCEGTYSDLENRWLESMPSEYIASYKSTYKC